MAISVAHVVGSVGSVPMSVGEAHQLAVVGAVEFRGQYVVKNVMVQFYTPVGRPPAVEQMLAKQCAVAEAAVA